MKPLLTAEQHRGEVAVALGIGRARLCPINPIPWPLRYCFYSFSLFASRSSRLRDLQPRLGCVTKAWGQSVSGRKEAGVRAVIRLLVDAKHLLLSVESELLVAPHPPLICSSKPNKSNLDLRSDETTR